MKQLIGYNLRALAAMLEGPNAVTKDIVANLEKETRRGKTFDELWEEDEAFVRTDLGLLAVLGAAALEGKSVRLENLHIFVVNKERCRSELLRVCARLFVPKVELLR